MIRIVAKMVIKEDLVDNFKATAKELITKSRAEEGNVSYSLNVSAESSNTFCFVEFWKDQEAVDKHNATEHFTTILPKLVDMASEAFPVEVYNEVEF